MRIVCLHPPRDVVACGAGPVRIGSDPEDTVILRGAGVEPGHLTLVADARGLVLGVRHGCQRIYVNARAVRERALLRYGDMVTLGTNRFVVTSDDPPSARADPCPDERAAWSDDAVLRIVTGARSGQALKVAGTLRIGRGSTHFPDLPDAFRVTRTSGSLAFEGTGDSSRINGWHCDHARLAPGDQILMGLHRLVVEAPGLQYAIHAASLPVPPPPPEIPQPGPSQTTGTWWLIIAAAVLALVIALFLYFHG